MIASLLEWDWSFGMFDHYPAESTFGVEFVRWGIFAAGMLMILIGFGGCN